MDSIYRALSTHHVWDQYGSSNALAFDVTELRLSHSKGTVKTQHSTVSISNLSAWLNDSQTKDIDGEVHSTFFRLVWVERNNETMQMNLPHGAFFTVLDAFDLQLANHYCASHFTGVTEVPRSSSKSSVTGQGCFTFCYHPKLAMLWSQVSPTATSAVHSSTNAVVLSNGSQIAAIKALFNTPWEANIVSHAMFPLLLCSLLLSQEIFSTQDSIKVNVREVEVRTGYHRFASRRGRPATGELGELSARMSGCETKLAGVTRKAKTLEELCGFMSRYSHTEPTSHMDEQELSQSSTRGVSSNGDNISGDEILYHSVGLLEERLRMQTADNDYVMQRVRIQIDALFNLITQHDSLISLKIAQASQLSAMSNQHDSSSMKTLAVVTMLFLPGSFVSSLFSIGFFDWGATASLNQLSVAVNPGFRLYWAVAIPLTLLVFALYALWLFFYRRKQKKLNHDAKWEITQPATLEEVRVLSARRETLHEETMRYWESFSKSRRPSP